MADYCDPVLMRERYPYNAHTFTADIHALCDSLERLQQERDAALDDSQRHAAMFKREQERSRSLAARVTQLETALGGMLISGPAHQLRDDGTCAECWRARLRDCDSTRRARG